MGRAAGHRLRRARDTGDHRGMVLALLPVVAVLAFVAGRGVAEPLAALLPAGPRPLLVALGATAILAPALGLVLLLRLDRPAPVRLTRGRVVGGAVAMVLLGANGLWASGLRWASASGQRARLGGAYDRGEPFLMGVGAGLLLVIAGALALWWWRRRAPSARPRNRRPR